MRPAFYIARVLLLFVFAFAVSRIIFVCCFLPQFAGEPITSVLLSFYYALKIDVATACYLLLLPLFITLIQCIYDVKIFDKIKEVYLLFIIFVNALITSADPGLYQEWGVKMNYRALLFLSHPSEVVYTATTHQLLFFIICTALQTVLSFYIYFRLVKARESKDKKKGILAFFVCIALVPLLVLGIRGGWQEVPIQVSDSYYSSNQHLNWAAVNTLWNIGQSVNTGMRYGSQNPYLFFKKKEAEAVVRDLYTENNDSTVLFIKDQHPNIVFIIFEGWSSDLIASISGNKEHGCTPNFDRMAAQGILFTQCIASGERSDQGLAAILSSFPSLPLSSIVNYPEKVDQLPSLLKPFKEKGYSSLFLFGGQLSYGNLKALIYHNGFDKVIEEKDIDHSIYRGRLGVHDEFTFDILQHELKAMKPPFMAGIFTQSTHFSYDYPKAKKPIAWAGGESDYANSMMYADSCLGDFFDKAKKQLWYDHTLFIMVADHSHVMPWNDDHSKAVLHHIPLLFYGDVVRNECRGTRKEATVSQQDICATLLSQLHIPHDNFKWSKDIMNTSVQHFAYWTFTDGFGFTRSPDCEFVYDLASKKIISSSASHCDSAHIDRVGLSYLQMVFEDFMLMGSTR
jgi:phosphoglycerol transferase MdoB-like AlkP superfamily enzyme